MQKKELRKRSCFTDISISIGCVELSLLNKKILVVGSQCVNR